MMTRLLPLAFIAAAAAAGACQGSQGGTGDKGQTLPTGYLRVAKTGSVKGPVTFFHRKHKKHALDQQKCQTCHHTGNWGQSCGEARCHTDPAGDRDGRRIHSLCIDKCHRTAGSKAPTDCSDGSCHGTPAT